MMEFPGGVVFADVCASFYLRKEKAWKSLARLISEYPLVAKALSGTSFSLRYTSFSLLHCFARSGGEGGKENKS